MNLKIIPIGQNFQIWEQLTEVRSRKLTLSGRINSFHTTSEALRHLETKIAYKGEKMNNIIE